MLGCRCIAQLYSIRRLSNDILGLVQKVIQREDAKMTNHIYSAIRYKVSSSLEGLKLNKSVLRNFAII